MTTTTPEQVVQAWTVYSAAQVEAAWRAGPAAGLRLLLFDDRYHALPRDLWLELCEEAHTDHLKYVRSFFDCNSFADALKGLIKAKWAVNGIGFVADTSGKHSFNVVLIAGDKGVEFGFIEPQRDTWIKPGSKPCYDLKQGYAFF